MHSTNKDVNIEDAVLVVAHPDDEILFGWPVFFNEEYEKHLIICSSDYYNENRKWCKYRKNSLKKVCELENVSHTCLDYNSSFYLTQTRRPPGIPSGEPGDSFSPFRAMCDDIVQNLTNRVDDYDYIFTHNPYGEYGHMDHKLLFELILKNTNKPLLFTDIVMSSNWSEGYPKRNKKIEELFYKNKKEDFLIDWEKYNKYKKIYEEDGVWTWSRKTPEKCSLFEV